MAFINIPWPEFTEPGSGVVGPMYNVKLGHSFVIIG